MKRILTASIAAILLIGLTAPLVLAKPSDDHPAPRDDARASHAAAEKGMLPGERAPERSHRAADTYIISISANGLTKDNESYSIVGEGRGLAKARESNETVQAIHGFARLNVTLKDADGAVVKDGVIRVRFVAHQNETGDWHWRLLSVMKTPVGLPKIFLHGMNGTVSDGVADLEGKGFALVKIREDDAVKRLRIRLDADVHIARA